MFDERLHAIASPIVPPPLPFQWYGRPEHKRVNKRQVAPSVELDRLVISAYLSGLRRKCNPSIGGFQMKRIFVVVFGIMLFVSLGGWAKTTSKQEKSSTTTASKAMNITGTVSADGKMFTADKTNKSWKIDNPDEIKAHEGHHVMLNANEDAATDTLHVNSVKMLSKSKGATKSNTSPSTKY